MKHKFLAVFRFTAFSLICLLAVCGSGALLIGCGSASADAAKKEKAKKKKAQKELEDEAERKDEEDNEAESAKTLEKEETDAGGEPNKTSVESASESKSEKKLKSGESKKTEEKNAGDEAEKIWKDLLQGNERYVAGRHTSAKYISVRKELTKGQSPEAVVLGCADSRVPPELVFDKNLGELFVVRAAGNIADTISLGSIEYAVEHLHSKVIVILGHESCGAVAAAVSDEEMPTKNLAAIVNKIVPALEGSKTCPLGGKINMSCVELNVRQSAADVLADSPIIKKAVKAGNLTIIRAVYQLESGKVSRLE